MSGAVPESLGHYRIVSLIGEGGMGEVYLADDTRLGRRVAIKILPETVSRVPEAKKRMLREARIVARLDHPNVCTIYEIGEHEGRPFIVMQYIEGETLYERLHRAHPHLDECVDIASQVASALDEAHGNGVVHRDIKTLNIMLTPRGQVKVLDFGLAKIETSDMSTEMMMSKPGSVTGTAPYMSPEQLRGLPIDGRSDIFSLGVVLFEMATGQRPFDRENAVSTITAILFEDPPPIEEDEYAPLGPIIRRALAKEPSKRYPTAAVMLEALQNTQKPRTRPIVAKIPSSRTPKPRGRIDSLAVLARTSAAPEPEHEYLVYGLGESIIGTLSQMRKLRVIAASTVARQAGAEFDAQAAGRELNVNAIVALTARVEQERLYADVELIATTDGAKLWSSQYMRPIREVAALAETIAGDVGEQVRARGTISSGPRRTTKKKRTVDPEAQQLFLKGRFQWIKRHPEALKLAMSYFQQAVEHDPSFALPYAGLADAFLMLGFMQALPPREILPKAKAAARHAIELDDLLADPHATLGYAAGLFEWDWEVAQRELDTAIRLNANYPWAPHWLGLLASGRGKTRHGLELIERAMTLDPLSPIINIAAGIPLHISRRYDEAIVRFRSVLETETSFAPGHYYSALSLEQRGDHDEAIGHLRRVMEIAGPASIYLGALAHTCARGGRIAEAEAIIEQLRELKSNQRYVTPFAFAVAYAGLDRNDDALAALGLALEERNAWMWFVPVDPRFDRLREDPRFAPLMERYGLPSFLETD